MAKTKHEHDTEEMGLRTKFTGTATYQNAKDKKDAKEYKQMREAKTAYLDERNKRLNRKK